MGHRYQWKKIHDFESSYLEFFSECHSTNILLNLLNKSLIAKSSVTSTSDSVYLNSCCITGPTTVGALPKTKGSYTLKDGT